MLNDLLVIGTGISGLTFAIKVAEQNPKLNITIISKGNLDFFHIRTLTFNQLKYEKIGAFPIEITRFSCRATRGETSWLRGTDIVRKS